jgi:hypothetical protein
VVAALAAGCGSKDAAPTNVLAGGKTLYESGDWAVVAKGAHAVAAHRRDGRWEPAPAGGLSIRVLGPAAGRKAARVPQVAAELSASTPLVESALWLDGAELPVKGGGSATRGTIYSAPAARLAQGRHVAIAYARTETKATAVAWTFSVG